MMDFIFLALIFALFLAAMLLMRLIDRLMA
jgi:hypothetical protein